MPMYEDPMERTGKSGTQTGGIGESSRSSGHGVGAIREKAADVGHDIRELAETTRDVAKEQLQRGKERARNWEEQMENSMRERPLRTLLIAGGVGLVLGMMLKR